MYAIINDHLLHSMELSYERAGLGVSTGFSPVGAKNRSFACRSGLVITIDKKCDFAERYSMELRLI